MPGICKAPGSSSSTVNKNNQGVFSYTCLYLKGVSLLGTGLFSKDTVSSSQSKSINGGYLLNAYI